MSGRRARLYEFAQGESGPIRQKLDLDAYSREIGVPERPLSQQQAGDAAEALAWTDRALALLARRPPTPNARLARAELAHRRERLLKKLAAPAAGGF